MKFRVENVHYMPKVLEPGILYVSKEFCTAAHLCACGCGAKIRTPLSPAEWSVEETASGPTVRPSIGNWQQPCKSHYIIWRGEIRWSNKWTEEQIVAGRIKEGRKLEAFCKSQNNRSKQPISELMRWIQNLFGSK